MARSRNIKPGFFLNEDLVELPFSTRLLFAGLWVIADREGRLEDRPRKIKMAIFPADDVDVERGLSELHGAGMIHRYIIENKRFIYVPGFVKHQNPHVHEQASVIPAPDLHGANTVDATPLTSSPIPDSLTPHTDNTEAEQNKKGGNKPHLLPKDFALTVEMIAYAYERGITNTQEVFEDFTEFWWHIATKHNKRTARGWLATWQKRIRVLAAGEPQKKSTGNSHTNGYDPKKDLLSPEYEMTAARTPFADAADYYFDHCDDGTREKYEGMKGNWLATKSAKGHEQEIEDYEHHSYKFRQRFSEAR